MLPSTRRIGTLVIALTVCTGCPSSGLELAVDLVTDLRPGRDFDRVRATVWPRAASETGARSKRRVRDASRAESFVDGARIAEFAGLPAGPTLLRAQLLDGDRIVAERLIAVPLDVDQLVRVAISSQCYGVVCPPGPSGEETCVDGVCVPPECSPDDPDACEEAGCRTNSDCVASVACATPVCREGVCIEEHDDTLCAADEYCDVRTGCRPEGGAEGCECELGSSCPGPGWPIRLGGSGFTQLASLSPDASGLYAGGAFDGSLVLDDRTVVANGVEVMLAAYGDDGVLRWARASEQAGAHQGSTVAVDREGNVYLGGEVDGSLELGGPPVVASGGAADPFVASFRRDGAHRWSTAWSSGGGYTSGLALAPDGTLVIGGYFAGTVSLGGGDLTGTGAGLDPFLGAVSSEDPLVHRWSQAWLGSGDDSINEIALNRNGDVFGAGAFVADLSVGGTDLSSAGDADVLVVGVDAGGAVRWAKGLGGSGRDAAFWIDVAGDRVYVTGFFQGEASFGGPILTSAGGNDWFVLALDAATGDTVWARSFGGLDDDQAWSLELASDGNLYVTGWFEDTVQVGAQRLTSGGGRDVLVVSLDPDGEPRWARAIGGRGDDIGQGTAALAGRLYVSGLFQGTVGFGCAELTASGHTDSFVVPIGF